MPEEATPQLSRRDALRLKMDAATSKPQEKVAAGTLLKEGMDALGLQGKKAEDFLQKAKEAGDEGPSQEQP